MTSPGDKFLWYRKLRQVVFKSAVSINFYMTRKKRGSIAWSNSLPEPTMFADAPACSHAVGVAPRRFDLNSMDGD